MSVKQLQHARKIVPIVSVCKIVTACPIAGPKTYWNSANKRGIGFIPWFPLAAGKLSGADSPITRVAGELKATPSQVALAWLLARSPVMLPIPGTSSVKHLEENLAAAELKLDENRKCGNSARWLVRGFSRGDRAGI